MRRKHALPLPGEPYQRPQMSGWPRKRACPPRLPAYSSAAPGRASARISGRDQGVVDDAIGLGQRVCRMEREQARIAGPAPTSQTLPGSIVGSAGLRGVGKRPSIAALYTAGTLRGITGA